MDGNNPRLMRHGGTQKSTLSSYWGEGSDGALSVSTNTTIPANSGNNVVKHYSSLSVSASSTLTFGASGYSLIYITGDLTLGAGCTLTVQTGASALAPLDIYVERNLINALGSSANLEAGTYYSTSCPAVGAGGGTSVSTLVANGLPGSSGSGGQTGGGGSGAGTDEGAGTSGSGAGAAGTALSGGSGGGGNRFSLYTSSLDGEANGGAGGVGKSYSTGGAAGGAGNPGGSGLANGPSAFFTLGASKTGPILILIVSGNVTLNNSSIVSTMGGAGGGIFNCNDRGAGGGGSGGGRIILLYGGNLINNGSVSASGGVGGAASGNNTSSSTGGSGGAGSVTIQQICNNV